MTVLLFGGSGHTGLTQKRTETTFRFWRVKDRRLLRMVLQSNLLGYSELIRLPLEKDEGAETGRIVRGKRQAMAALIFQTSHRKRKKSMEFVALEAPTLAEEMTAVQTKGRQLQQPRKSHVGDRKTDCTFSWDDLTSHAKG